MVIENKYVYYSYLEAVNLICFFQKTNQIDYL